MDMDTVPAITVITIEGITDIMIAAGIVVGTIAMASVCLSGVTITIGMTGIKEKSGPFNGAIFYRVL
jgi:hypothetical protein